MEPDLLVAYFQVAREGQARPGPGRDAVDRRDDGFLQASNGEYDRVEELAEVLAEIRSDPALRDIPVVVLTTSKAEEDVLRSYSLGANSFIVKPVSFAGLVDVMRSIDEYWFEMVRLPAHPGAVR